MSRIAVPAVALATALAAVLSAKRHADARALDNVGLRGGLTERDLDEYEALLASADPKLRNKAIEKLTELALVGSYKSRLMDTLDGQHGATEPEQYMASAIIAELSRDELNKARLAENGALFLLGKQLKSSTSDRVRQHCAQAIYRIIFNDVDRRLMVATCGLVPELLAILLSQDQCPHGLVYYSIGILHQFSQCACVTRCRSTTCILSHASFGATTF
ncbi:hypothetical protein BC828DRAFT_29367 [Blastocladiella britannica]|nr:hypothetical protein BC828DRAFT_29367 [Blastocladiella britannica]